jgi:two-component system, NarL family, invasion response regulator UvrY
MTNAVTVLAVDDQPIFLRTVAGLVAATPGFEQVGEATSGPEALELAAALEPDLVLLDVRMPGMDGIETAQRLAEAASRAVVVLISIDDLPDVPWPGVAAHVRKKDLSVLALRRLWDVYGRGARDRSHLPGR